MTHYVKRRPDWLERPTPNEGDGWLDARVTMRRTDIKVHERLVENDTVRQWVAVYGHGNSARRNAKRSGMLGKYIKQLQEQSYTDVIYTEFSAPALRYTFGGQNG